MAKKFSETLLSVLDKEKVLGGEDVEYGSWSPQNYRALILTPWQFISVKHVPTQGRKSLVKLINTGLDPQNMDQFVDNVWKGFGSKKFGALEMIMIDHNLVPMLFQDRYMSAFEAVLPRISSRLTGIYVNDFVSNENLASQMVHALVETDMTVVDLASESGSKCVWPSTGPRPEALGEFSPSPKNYTLDQRGSALDRHLHNNSRKSAGGGFPEFEPGELSDSLTKIMTVLGQLGLPKEKTKTVLRGAYFSWMMADKPVADFKEIWKSQYADAYDDPAKMQEELNLLKNLNYIPKEGEQGAPLSDMQHICLHSEKLRGILKTEFANYAALQKAGSDR